MKTRRSDQGKSKGQGIDRTWLCKSACWLQGLQRWAHPHYSNTGLNHWFQGRTWLRAVARAPQWFTSTNSAELLWWSWGPNDGLGIKRAGFTSNSDQRSSAWFWPSHHCPVFQFCSSKTQQLKQWELFFCWAVSQEQFSALPGSSATLQRSLWHTSERAVPGAPGSPFHCRPQDLSPACPGTVFCHTSPAVPGITGCANSHLLKSCDVLLGTCSVSLSLSSPPVCRR